MPEYYSPGVHIEKTGREEKQLEIVRTDCAVFFGVTERGPVNRAVGVNSFTDFKQKFGQFLPSTYLPYAVYGFFLNGGRKCYIVRVAHLNRRATEEILTPSSVQIGSVRKKPVFEVEAKSGGTWGNRISIELSNSRPLVSSYLVSEASQSSDSISLESTHRFSRGDLLYLKGEEKRDFVQVEAIEGNRIRIVPGSLKNEYYEWDTVSVYAMRYDLDIKCGDIKEKFRNLSPTASASQSIVNKVNKDSQLVNIESLTAGNTVLLPAIGSYQLSEGKDGFSSLIPDDYIGLAESDSYTGMALLDRIEEGRVIALPDLYSHLNLPGFGGEEGIRAVIRNAIDRVENGRYQFLLIDPPPNLSIRKAMKWRERIDSSYAATVWPWFKAKVYQSEAVLPVKPVPPSGYVAGMIARLDIEGGTHHSFANHEIEGVVDSDSELTQYDTEMLNPEGINAVLAFPGRGIRVWGARTLSSDSAYRYVNVRRTFNMIAESIESGTQWVVFEPNDPSLWQEIKRHVSIFLRDLWRKGYLQGDSVEEAFYIKIDEENNPAEIRDRGELIIEIGVAIVRPAEFIIVRVAQKTMETQKE